MKKAFFVIGIFVAIVAVIVVVVNLSRGTFIRRALDSHTGVRISTNSGGDWENVLIADQNQRPTSVNVLTLAITPHQGFRSYLGAERKGLLTSDDRGASWYRIEDKNNILSQSANIFSIAIDPQNRERLYLAVRQNGLGFILKSEDGGGSFKQVYVTSTRDTLVTFVAIDPRLPNIVWAATSEGVILKSVNGGQTWRKVYEDKRIVPNTISINHANTGEVLVGTTRDGLIRTRDGGTTWLDLSEGLRSFRGARRIVTIVRDPRNPAVLYLGSNFGLLRSGDSGSSWSPVNLVIPLDSLPVQSVAVHPQDNRIIYAAAANNLYKSIDGGRTWAVQKPIAEDIIRVIKIDTLQPNRVIIGIHN